MDPLQPSQKSEQKPAIADGQISLAQMFGWFTLICLVVTSCIFLSSSIPDKAFNSPEPSPITTFIPPVLTWVVLLALYLWRSQILPLMIHVLPSIFLIAALAPGQFLWKESTLILVSSLIVSAVFSFAMLCQAKLLALSVRTSNPKDYFVVCIIFGSLLTTAICNLDSIVVSSRLALLPSIFGLMLGFVFGLYHAVAGLKFLSVKDSSQHAYNILQIRFCLVVLCGLIGAICGPLLDEFFDARNYLNAYYVAPRYSPVIGISIGGTAFFTFWMLQRFHPTTKSSTPKCDALSE